MRACVRAHTHTHQYNVNLDPIRELFSLIRKLKNLVKSKSEQPMVGKVGPVPYVTCVNVHDMLIKHQCLKISSI